MSKTFEIKDIFVEAERVDNGNYVQGLLVPKQPKGRCGVNWLIVTVNTGRPVSYEIKRDTVRLVEER